MSQIKREGRVAFGEASLSVSEEGISAARETGGYAGQKAWERQFKRDVFKRIIQQLRRIGWTCTMPAIEAHDVKHYGGRVARWSAESKRFCQKGDLKADLDISGRCINLKMFQSVNCPTRSDHEGRYESNLEAVMPYQLRLEMERTRRRIRDYLCNVFEGYVFDPKYYSIYRKPLSRTAMERIEQHYSESWHFKGDWSTYSEQHNNKSIIDCHNGNRRSGDGALLDHGQRVWFFDRRGRIATGIALYNINNMWWVVTGRYDYTNMACFELFARLPENIRVRRNSRLRRQRLEAELAKSVKAMNFERAAVLRDIAFPTKEPLFVVWHDDHKSYHCSGFSGYSNDLNNAGKFTAAEVAGWGRAPNKIIPMESCQ